MDNELPDCEICGEEMPCRDHGTMKDQSTKNRCENPECPAAGACGGKCADDYFYTQLMLERWAIVRKKLREAFLNFSKKVTDVGGRVETD